MSTLPKTLLPPFSGDLYAPSWAAVTPQLPGWCDVEYDFPPVQVSVAPGAQSLKNPIPIDLDADYLALEFFCAPIAGSTVGFGGSINPADLKVRLTDGDGRFITSDWITANDLCGPVGAAALGLRKGSTVTVDFWNQGPGSLVVQAGFKGMKRFPCSNEQGPIPPFRSAAALYCNEWAGARFEDFEYFYEFSNGASALFPPWAVNLQPSSPNSVFQKFVLPMDNDAHFLLRGITGMIMQENGPVIIPGKLFLTFYDPNIVPMAAPVPRATFAPAIAGPGAEMVISNGGGRTSPLFPEVLIRRGSNLMVDVLLQIAGGKTASFSLRGLKVYENEVCA